MEEVTNMGTRGREVRVDTWGQGGEQPGGSQQPSPPPCYTSETIKGDRQLERKEGSVPMPISADAKTLGVSAEPSLTPLFLLPLAQPLSTSGWLYL